MNRWRDEWIRGLVSVYIIRCLSWLELGFFLHSGYSEEHSTAQYSKYPLFGGIRDHDNVVGQQGIRSSKVGWTFCCYRLRGVFVNKK